MPQKKVPLTPVGPKDTPERQSKLTIAGRALSTAKKRATEKAVKSPVKSPAARPDKEAANEKRAAARQAKKDAAAAAMAAKAEKNKATREANKAAKSAAQAELNKTREAHLDPHNTYHQTHNNIDGITNDIVNAHINGNHDDLVDHAHHLVTVLNKHGSALKVGTGRTSQSRGHVERVKSLLRGVVKNKKVSPEIRDKAKRIANDHLTHHVPDAPAPKPAKPGIVDRIKSMFEEVELHEDYGAGDVGTDEVVRKYKSMTPGEQKNEVKLSESYVLWLIENEQLDEASFHYS
jgi:hypothetical protein